MVLSRAEISKHNLRASCWIIIKDQVYDVTSFLDSHPGGASSILRSAGKDATDEYEPIHPPGTIEKNLAPELHLGTAETLTKQETVEANEIVMGKDDNSRPPLSTLQNLDDFEYVARKVLSKKAWIYYSSAADTLSSNLGNHADWQKIHFRPRVLRNVAKVSMKTTIMGHESALPIFISPAALAKLGHEDGELCLGRGAAKWNIPYCCSTYSSVSHAEIAACMKSFYHGDDSGLLFQLYVPIKKTDAKRLIREAKRLRCKAIVVTVDSAVIGKREEDDRYKAQMDYEAGVTLSRTSNPDPAIEVPVPRGAHTSTLDWEDLNWIREEWGTARPLILKGIQTAEDALLASRVGVSGIWLSNHGGRQLDYAPSSVKTLLEIRKFCPTVLQKLEVYIDGGVTRGSDVVKALCLGAKGVGLGRPFMYALSGYGAEGVVKAIDMLSDEIQTTMRLLGVTSLDKLSPAYVNTKGLEQLLPSQQDIKWSDTSSKL